MHEFFFTPSAPHSLSSLYNGDEYIFIVLHCDEKNRKFLSFFVLKENFSTLPRKTL
jgi:hypothetical protein